MQTMSSTLKPRGAKAAALMLCLAATGCVSVAPSVPPDISSTSTAFDVRSAGRINQLFGDGYFEVGNYRITGIQHGVVRGNELSIGQYSQTSFSGRFQFVMAGPRDTWTARCERVEQSKTITMRRMDVESSTMRLVCELTSGERRATLEMRDESRGLYGTVQVANNSYALRQYSYGPPNTRTAYVPDALGLRIDRGGRNVAALAFAHPGTFWLNGSLAPEQQDAFAGVLAALLIHAKRY